MSLGQAKHYVVFDSNCNTWYYDVYSLSQFCKDHNLNENCMRDVSKGRQLFQHKGFYCELKTPEAIESIKFKLQSKKFHEICACFNKIKKPLNKKKRYNQSNDYIDFLNNVEKYYQEYHVKQKMSCDEIAKNLNKDSESIRLLFAKNNLPRLNYNYNTTSKGENEITEFLNELIKDKNSLFIKNKKILSPYELDGYNKDLNLAFEYCGLYWHSEYQKTDINYHKKKYDLCVSKNIKLFTIFEDEWKYKQEQVKSFLKAQIGLFKERIHARDCNVIEIEKSKSYQFFKENHIQSSPANIEYSFALMKHNNILAVISFAPHHRQFNYWTINRLAFVSNVQVIGGASKLIINALKKLRLPKVITWSDNRWSDGKIYEKCGFVLDQILPPDYSYTNFVIRKSKQSMKKSETKCPIGMTEHQWAIENKWYRIYDCGKKRWIWNHDM